jgi:apolipoprotein N-acyltransferase
MADSGKSSVLFPNTIAMSKWWRLALATVSGFLLTIAFPPFHFYLAAWLSLMVLMTAIAGARPSIGALCGFLHGVVFFTPTLSWLYDTFRIHGGVSELMSTVSLCVISAGCSVFPMLFGWSFALIARRSASLAALAAPFLWVAQEFAKDRLPAVGFPWNLLGYAGAHSLVLAQLAVVGGVWLLSFLIAAFSALVFWAIVERHSGKRTPLYIAAVTILALAFGVGFGGDSVPRATPDHVARLVQSDFPLSDTMPPDWLQSHAQELDEIGRLSTGRDAAGNRPGLVVWSEVPAPFSMQEPAFAARAIQIGRGTTDGFLAGVVDWKVKPGEGWRAFNSAVLIAPSGRETFLYDKVHLVPFSEYLPWSHWFGFVRRITLDVASFSSGTEYKVGTLADGRRFGVFICYESVFPGEVRQFVANGAEVLINISDDAWFGRSAAPEQHLEMLRVRAAENRRWLLRSTNNGHTVVVDPYGRIVAELPVDTRGALEAPYAYRDDLTLYTRWGDWVPWTSVIVGLGITVFGIAFKKPKEYGKVKMKQPQAGMPAPLNDFNSRN